MSLRRRDTSVVARTLHVQHPKLPAVKNVGALYRSPEIYHGDVQLAEAKTEEEWRTDLQKVITMVEDRNVPVVIDILPTLMTLSIDIRGKRILQLYKGQLIRTTALNDPTLVEKIVSEFSSRMISVVGTTIRVIF